MNTPRAPVRTSLRLRIVLLAGGLLVALVLAEALLRWVLPYHFIYKHPQFVLLNQEGLDQSRPIANWLIAPALAVNDKPSRYGLQPNLRARLVSSEFDVSFETNHHGVRGPALLTKPDLRILGLGDSFAIGFGVERHQTYLWVLARRWRQQSEEAIEPVNAGVIGYNPYNSARYLFSEAATLQPDLVVLQLWVGDDLCRSSSAARPVLKAEEPPATTFKFLLLRSHLGMLVRDRLRAITPIRRWLMDHDMIHRYAIDRLLSVDFPDRCSAQLEALSTLLAEIEAFCRQRDIRLVLLLIPVREQVYEHDWERAIEYDAVEIEAEKVDFDAPNRVLQSIARERGIALFDATEALRTYRDGGRLYFDGLDPHLTRRGHEVVGTALFRFLHGTPEAP